MIRCLLAVALVASLACLSEGQGAEGGDCSFPQYLRDRPRWEGKISYARRKTRMYWKFYANTVEMIDYSTTTPVRYEQRCEEQLPGSKFLLRETHGGRQKYVCMQFVKRSDHVIQIKTSDRSPDRSARLCDDDNMVLDKWPLVWPKADEKYTPCPLSGGFDFHVTDHTVAETTCEDNFLMPHLESECTSGEGLKIDFRHFQCRGRLDMELVNEFVCLGSWEDAGYTYSMLTDRDEFWPKLWLLRYPTDHGGAFKAHLFGDIVVEHTETPRSTKRYYTLHMKRTIYPSLCENEATFCGEECGLYEAHYCQQACTGCDHSLSVPKCTFPEGSRGEWLEMSARGQRHITVTTSMLYPDDLLPLQCYDLNAQAWFEGQGRRALATIFKNGCRPRYTCAEFQRLSDSVVLHRLSQNLIWPQAIGITAQTVCRDDVFSDDPPPLLNRIRSGHPKALVKKLGPNGKRESVPCNINKHLGLGAHFRNSDDPTWCEAEMNACYSNTSFSVRLFPGCTKPHESSLASYGCLATWGEDGDQFIITENKEDSSDVKCWLFHRDAWSSTSRIFLMEPAECHRDAAQNIEYKNYTNYIAKFEVQTPDGDSCHVGMESSTQRVGFQTSRPVARSSRVVTLSTSTVVPIHKTSRVSGMVRTTPPTGPKSGQGNNLDLGDKTRASRQQDTSAQSRVRPSNVLLALVLMCLMASYNSVFCQ